MEKGGGNAASSRADATSSFTVFVSPPWSVPSSVKHVTFSEAFPAIGGLGVGGSRRVRMTLSRSLESIPENSVWHAGKGIGGAGAAAASVYGGGGGGGVALRDASVTGRGSLLPPIRQVAFAGGDLDLPEMRARAFSDPNAYQTASTKDRHQYGSAAAVAPSLSLRAETGGGGASKAGGAANTAVASTSLVATATPRPPATPPKKPPSPKAARRVAAAALSTAKRSQQDSNGGDDVDSLTGTGSAVSAGGGVPPSKERADARLGGSGNPKAAIASDRVLNALATDAGSGAAAGITTHRHAAAAAGSHSSPSSGASSPLKGGGGGAATMTTASHAAAAATAAGNGVRGKVSTTSAAAGDLPSPPIAASQRNHNNKAASSGAAVSSADEHVPMGTQPRIIHPPNVDRGGRGQLSRHARHIDKEIDTSRTAFALVGSPGRRRWPSPHREATSFITATPKGRPIAGAAATASLHGSHSYSGPMSPIAAAAAREDAAESGSGGSSVGGSEESLNWSGGGVRDSGRWCAATSAKPAGAIDIPSAAASTASAVSGAGACSKEFQTILSGFISSGSAPSAAAIGREGAYARDGRQAPDDPLAETRAHFLRAGCMPISDSL